MSSPTCTSIDSEGFNHFLDQYLASDPLTLERQKILGKFTSFHIYALIAIITGQGLAAVHFKRTTSYFTARLHPYITTPLRKSIACVLFLVYGAFVVMQTMWVWDLCRGIAIVFWADRPAEHVGCGLPGLGKYFTPCWREWFGNAGNAMVFVGFCVAWCVAVLYVYYESLREIIRFEVPEARVLLEEKNGQIEGRQ
ncbi:hypothetical protein BDV06DRAFT_229111 [Aspergillus oleicola]